MSLHRYTPGPWEVADNLIVVDGEIVAKVRTKDFDTDTILANAALIAAAPELLNTLEVAARILTDFSLLARQQNKDELSYLIAKHASDAYTVIAKAKGEKK